MKHNKVTVQSAHEFFNYIKSLDSKITFLWISDSEIKENEEDVQDFKNASSVPNTLKIHNVIPGPFKETILSRQLSCCCKNCIQLIGNCDLEIKTQEHVFTLHHLKATTTEEFNSNDLLVINADDDNNEFYLFKLSESFISKKRLSCPTYGIQFTKGVTILKGQYLDHLEGYARCMYTILPENVFLSPRCVMYTLRSCWYSQRTDSMIEFYNDIHKYFSARK